MSIKILIDTTNATAEELESLKQLIDTDLYFTNKLRAEKNIEVVVLGEYEKRVAINNGCTIKVGMDEKVIIGAIPREVAEKTHSAKG